MRKLLILIIFFSAAAFNFYFLAMHADAQCPNFCDPCAGGCFTSGSGCYGGTLTIWFCDTSTGQWTDSGIGPCSCYAYSQSSYYGYSQSSYYGYSQSVYYAYSQSSYTIPSPGTVTISAPSVRADGATQYTVRVTANDAGGGTTIHHQYALINFLGGAPNQGQHRGYLTMVFPSNAWAGHKDNRACTGGGWGAVASLPPYDVYGPQYINLDSCTVTTVGNTRTTDFVIRFNPLFTSPTTNNDIAGYIYDAEGNAAWTNSDINFGLTIPTLSASPGSLSVTQNATATWTGSINASDWIGLFPVGAADTAYIRRVYANNCTIFPGTPGAVTATGSCNFLMNSIGTYEFRMFANGTMNKIATSNTFTVTAAPPSSPSVTISAANIRADNASQYTITVSASETTGGANITHEYALINFQGSNAGQYRGYLTFYYDGTYTGWDTWKNKQSCAGGGIAAIGGAPYPTNHINLDSCSTSVAGNIRTTSFVVRFDPSFTAPLTNNDISGYAQNIYGPDTGWVNFDINFGLTVPTLSASPASVLTGQNTTVSWTGSTNANDWIGLFPVGAPDTGYVRRVYANNCTNFPGTPGAVTPSGSCNFLMSTTGSYEFRMFANGTTNKVATSASSVNVLGNVSANIACSPDTIVTGNSSNVSWSSTNAASCTVSPSGWTGTSGSQSTGVLTSTTTYTVTCMPN